MAIEPIFQTHLVLGYVAWLLCFRAYVLPWLDAMDRVQAHRAIATLHSFRFFGLVFIMPGVVGANLPASFAVSAAYGDLAAGVLAMLALLSVRLRPAFWIYVVSFNLVGLADLILNYAHAIQIGLPARAGDLGGAYAIPILYVPLLTITHVYAIARLLKGRPNTARDSTGETAPSASRL